MNEFGKNVCDKAIALEEGIDKKKKILAFIYLSGNHKLKKRVSMLPVIESIIDENLQTGNYRRACRYLSFLHRILLDVERCEKEILSKLTEIIIDSNVPY